MEPSEKTFDSQRRALPPVERGYQFTRREGEDVRREDHDGAAGDLLERMKSAEEFLVAFEELTRPTIMIEESRRLASEEGMGRVNGFNRRKPSFGIDADFRDAWICRPPFRQTPRGNRPKRGLHRRHQSPGRVEDQQTLSAIRLAEQRSLQGKSDIAAQIRGIL